MENKEIQDLIDFIAKSTLDEVSVETESIKLKVKRHSTGPVVQVAAAPVAAAAAPIAPAASAPASAAAPAAPAKADSNLIAVKSPMIGTFYRAPNADSPAFVEVGQEVKKGDTVCIIEAMKLFNEIECEVSGKIAKAMVENSSPVEFDQVLFYVDPS
jgi:acetyl-CoA carboxylase biotin carboxyl carrier protein